MRKRDRWRDKKPTTARLPKISKDAMSRLFDSSGFSIDGTIYIPFLRPMTIEQMSKVSNKSQVAHATYLLHYREITSPERGSRHNLKKKNRRTISNYQNIKCAILPHPTASTESQIRMAINHQAKKLLSKINYKRYKVETMPHLTTITNA